MTWFARQMQSYSKNGTNITYTYDADGLRTEKTVNNIKHEYYYVDGQLRYEKNGDSYEMYYNYDIDGRPVRAYKKDLVTGTNYSYYLITNTRGDVIETRDGNGNVNAKYTYDSWGKLISVTDANGNALPETSFAHQISLRYRGYVYDTETGLYYLQSRYYDPEVGRFINADDVDYIGIDRTIESFNAFIYCKNNPIYSSDQTGFLQDQPSSGKINKALNIIKKYSSTILECSRKYGIDPIAIAGVIFVEQAYNYDIIDKLVDRIGAKLLDTSLGLGQIRFSKAKMVEEGKTIIPYITSIDGNEKVWNVPGYGKYNGSYEDAIIKRVYIDKENINYVSAFLSYIQKQWISYYSGISSDVGMLASLYNYSEVTPSNMRYINEFGRAVEQYKDRIEQKLYEIYFSSAIIYLFFLYQKLKEIFV